MEQAPIGRVSLVYVGAWANDGSAWIGVGADGDEYRWVGQEQTWCGNCGAGHLDVSADGSLITQGLQSEDYQTFAIQLTSAESGEVTWIPLQSPEGLGGEILDLRISPSGDRLAVLTAVIVENLGETGHRWEQRLYVFDQVTSTSRPHATTVPIDGLFDTSLVGWTSDEAPVLLNDGGREPGAVLTVVRGARLATVGRVDSDSRDTDSWSVSPFALSPDGLSLAVLDDPTPSGSGDGAAWRLQVFDTASGDLQWEHQGLPEDSSEVVGWTADGAPVVSVLRWERRASNRAGVSGGFEIYRPGEEAEVLVSSWPGDRYGSYHGARVASDVLAAGQLREAQPPDQPWYDLRTLGPATEEWVAGHKTLMALIVVALVGAIVVLARRRRAV